MNHLFTSPSLGSLWVCVAIAIASSSISITITQTEIFAPFRRWSEKLGHMIGYLFQCFYCINHWVIGLGIFIYQPTIITSGHLLVDLVVSAFFTLTLSVLVSGLMFQAFLAAVAKRAREVEMKEILAKSKAG